MDLIGSTTTFLFSQTPDGTINFGVGAFIGIMGLWTLLWFLFFKFIIFK